MSRLDSRLPDRFWAKVAQDPKSGCWIWNGYTKPCGYGEMVVGSRADGSRRTVMVHRYAYENLVGRVPVGLQLDHLCRTRRCANPAHLEPVTQYTNIMRGTGMAARHAALALCKRGHDFAIEGAFYVQSHNGRRRRTCRACRRIRYSERRAA